MKSIINLKNISFIRNGRVILDRIDLDIKENENWVVLGKNGSGKSTLINLIYGYHWFTFGEITILGNAYGEIALQEIHRQIGILQEKHQEDRMQRNLTIKEILGTGIFASIGLYGDFTKEHDIKLDKIISENKWIKDPNQMFRTLSSGERKKILLLRALILDPKILILDEPTESLDIHAREDFNQLLTEVKNKLNFTTILITHRTEEIPSFFDHVCMMKEGQILKSGKIDEIMNDESLSNLYDLPIHINIVDGRYYTQVKN